MPYIPIPKGAKIPEDKYGGFLLALVAIAFGVLFCAVVFAPLYQNIK